MSDETLNAASPAGPAPSRDVQLNLESAKPPIAWHAVLQGMLIHPFTTLNALAEHYPDPGAIDTPLLRQQAILTLGVIVVQLVWGLLRTLNTPNVMDSVGQSFALSGLFHLALWLLLAAGVALAGYTFQGHSRYGLLLTLTGASTLPWLLLPVVGLLKAGLPFIGQLVYVLLWLWTTVLYLKAIKLSFGWNLDRLMLGLSLPIVVYLWVGLAIFAFFFGLSH